MNKIRVSSGSGSGLVTRLPLRALLCQGNAGFLAFRSVSIHCQYSGEYATQGSRFSSFTNNVRGEWMQEEVIQEVLQQVDRERLIELACNVANIIGITGEEEGIAEFSRSTRLQKPALS